VPKDAAQWICLTFAQSRGTATCGTSSENIYVIRCQSPPFGCARVVARWISMVSRPARGTALFQYLHQLRVSSGQ
jgi:hypothetical protein